MSKTWHDFSSPDIFPPECSLLSKWYYLIHSHAQTKNPSYHWILQFPLLSTSMSYWIYLKYVPQIHPLPLLHPRVQTIIFNMDWCNSPSTCLPASSVDPSPQSSVCNTAKTQCWQCHSSYAEQGWTTNTYSWISLCTMIWPCLPLSLISHHILPPRLDSRCTELSCLSCLSLLHILFPEAFFPPLTWSPRITPKITE